MLAFKAVLFNIDYQFFSRVTVVCNHLLSPCFRVMRLPSRIIAHLKFLELNSWFQILFFSLVDNDGKPLTHHLPADCVEGCFLRVEPGFRLQTDCATRHKQIFDPPIREESAARDLEIKRTSVLAVYKDNLVFLEQPRSGIVLCCFQVYSSLRVWYKFADLFNAGFACFFPLLLSQLQHQGLKYLLKQFFAY